MTSVRPRLLEALLHQCGRVIQMRDYRHDQTLSRSQVAEAACLKSCDSCHTKNKHKVKSTTLSKYITSPFTSAVSARHDGHLKVGEKISDRSFSLILPVLAVLAVHVAPLEAPHDVTPQSTCHAINVAGEFTI